LPAFARHFSQGARSARRQDDVGSAGGKGVRHAAADAARGAGDHHDLVSGLTAHAL
jgi:hypothetical protein